MAVDIDMYVVLWLNVTLNPSVSLQDIEDSCSPSFVLEFLDFDGVSVCRWALNGRSLDH